MFDVIWIDPIEIGKVYFKPEKFVSIVRGPPERIVERVAGFTFEENRCDICGPHFAANKKPFGSGYKMNVGSPIAIVKLNAYVARWISKIWLLFAFNLKIFTGDKMYVGT